MDEDKKDEVLEDVEEVIEDKKEEITEDTDEGTETTEEVSDYAKLEEKVSALADRLDGAVKELSDKLDGILTRLVSRSNEPDKVEKTEEEKKEEYIQKLKEATKNI